MELRRPFGHAELIAGLWRAAQAGRLGHALLFEGQGGIGKFLAATWLCQGLLCQRGPLQGRSEPCGACPGCKKLASGGYRGNHPDCLVIDRAAEIEAGDKGGPSLSVAHIAVRSGDERGSNQPLEEFLSLKPNEGPLRIVLLREAERLTEAAQNALLKTLEEPSLGTFLVLETSAPQALLTTLRSRVLRVRLEPLGLPDFLSWAATQTGIDREQASRAHALCGGSPGQLLAFFKRGGPALVELWLETLSGRWVGTEAFLEAPGEYEATQELARRRERVRMCLQVLGQLLRDLWLLNDSGVAEAELAFAERRAELEALAGSIPTARLRALLARAGDLASDLDANVDPAATLERALASCV
jgi:DNA polymerase III subunit delta'